LDGAGDDGHFGVGLLLGFAMNWKWVSFNRIKCAFWDLLRPMKAAVRDLEIDRVGVQCGNRGRCYGSRELACARELDEAWVKSFK